MSVSQHSLSTISDNETNRQINSFGQGPPQSSNASLPGSSIPGSIPGTASLHHSSSASTVRYPNIKDYYMANSTQGTSIPIQLQKGLSNFSSLQLGDDRISFNESVLSEAFRTNMETKLRVASPSKLKTIHARIREYSDANSKVPENEMDRLERVMKDKLIQRANISKYQVTKTFKFFDREHTNRIPIEAFTKALEILGFQFSTAQNCALFARYDKDFNGTIDYVNFITKAMFYERDEDVNAPVAHVPLHHHHHHHQQAHMDASNKPREFPDMDANEIKALQEVELRKYFNKVDRNHNGFLNRDDFEILLMALGYYTNDKELDRSFNDLTSSGMRKVISFDDFFHWWTTDATTQYVRHK